MACDGESLSGEMEEKGKTRVKREKEKGGRTYRGRGEGERGR